MSKELHKNDIGTIFKVTIREASEDDSVVGDIIDLSSASEKTFIFVKPDGTRVEKDCSFYTDGSDGIITYTTIDGDLSVAGIWRMQAYVKIGSSEHYSDVATFKVRDNL